MNQKDLSEITDQELVNGVQKILAEGIRKSRLLQILELL